MIERNPVSKGELGNDELQEFVQEVGDCRPLSAARWLQDFLHHVKVIYAFQVLDGTNVKDGWEILRNVQEKIWNSVGGILQADGEGFSNRDGFHILWQFGDSVKGKWKMSVLDQEGTWRSFEMELGDKEQRSNFLNGEIPKGAKLL